MKVRNAQDGTLDDWNEQRVRDLSVRFVVNDAAAIPHSFFVSLLLQSK